MRTNNCPPVCGGGLFIKGNRMKFPTYEDKDGTNLASLGTDCISREQAIDICDHAIDLLKGQFGAGALVAIKESIEELPPAQPEHIIHCKDCKYFKQVFAPNDNDGLCGHWHSKYDARTNRNDYCSHAERKEETE